MDQSQRRARRQQLGRFNSQQCNNNREEAEAARGNRASKLHELEDVTTMISRTQAREIARAQAQYLALSLTQAREHLRSLVALRSIFDADSLADAILAKVDLACKAYERQFRLLHPQLHDDDIEAPADLLRTWLHRDQPRDERFRQLCQWAIAQRLYARFLIERSATHVTAVALARFCIAISEEARSCIQQTGGEGAVLLAHEINEFKAALDEFTGAVNGP